MAQILERPYRSLADWVRTRGGALSTLVSASGTGAYAHAYMLTAQASRAIVKELAPQQCDVQIDMFYNSRRHPWMKQVHLNQPKQEWWGVSRSTTQQGLFAQRLHISDIQQVND